jgi:hypothetical protein
MALDIGGSAARASRVARRTRARAPGAPPVGHLRGARGTRAPPSNRPSTTRRHGAAPEGGPPAAVGSVLPPIPSAACRAERGRRPGPRADARTNATSDAAVPAAKGVTRSADEARAFRSPSGAVDGRSRELPCEALRRRGSSAGEVATGSHPRGGGRLRSALPVALAVWSAARCRATGFPPRVRHRAGNGHASGASGQGPGSGCD